MPSSTTGYPSSTGVLTLRNPLSSSTPTAIAGRRLAVVALDGNGQQPPEIVDLAVLPIGPGTAPVPPTGLLTWLIRPVRPITAAVTRLHGIRNCEVFACPGWSRVAVQVYDALCGRVLVAHSAGEHLRMLAAHLPGWQPPLVLDTARLARTVWPRLALPAPPAPQAPPASVPRTGGYGLDRLVTHAGLVAPPVEPGRRRHRAGYDAWMTGQLLIDMVRRAGLTWDQLVATARLPGA